MRRRRARYRLQSKRLRTTEGTTAIPKVVPPGLDSADVCRVAAATTPSSGRPPQSLERPQLRPAAATRRHRWAAPCAAPADAREGHQSRNHDVSDPGWRAGFCPTCVRRGRSRHGCWCRCRYRCGPRLWPPRAAGPPSISRRISVRLFREVRGPFLRKNLVRSSAWTWATRRPPAITRSSLDLCSAPSRRVASLRPREHERPSGLDRACAQITFRQLRDDRQVCDAADRMGRQSRWTGCSTALLAPRWLQRSSLLTAPRSRRSLFLSSVLHCTPPRERHSARVAGGRRLRAPAGNTLPTSTVATPARARRAVSRRSTIACGSLHRVPRR